MNLKKFYMDNKFGVLIDLRSMADHTMHGNSTRLVNTTSGIQLELQWSGTSSGNVDCHVFVISYSQFNMVSQLDSVQF